MRRRVLVLLIALIGAVTLLSASPAGAVKDGPGCGAGVGLPGKEPIVRIYC